MPSPILLYDGVCGLCNRFVQFTLRRDRREIFRFASLQSPLAAGILARHGVDARELDTVYVVSNPVVSNPVVSNPVSPNEDCQGEREVLLSRSAAVLFVLQHLGGFWRLAGFLLRLLPKFLLDSAYNVVARNRYRIFGRSETCVLPTVQDRSRFLD
jgi:predicted DCC family thiol-disulfide oxidoreductase YuxK